MEVFLTNRKDGTATVCLSNGNVVALNVEVKRYAYFREYFQFWYKDVLWACWLTNWGHGKAYEA